MRCLLGYADADNTTNGPVDSASGRRRLLSDEEHRLRRMILDFHGTRRSVAETFSLRSLGSSLGGINIIPSSNSSNATITEEGAAKVWVGADA
jgi:hypothetical protein